MLTVIILFPRRYYVEASGARSYDVSPDGQRFLMIKEGDSAGDLECAEFGAG